MIYALRGAITVEKDTAEAVDDAVKELMSEIFSANSLSEDDIISVIFSQTKDIRSRNAAAACRRGGFCADMEKEQEVRLATLMHSAMPTATEPLSAVMEAIKYSVLKVSWLVHGK